MINYIVFVNNNKDVIILDTECSDKYSPDIGYQADPKWDWATDNKNLREDNDYQFDIDKAFPSPGIYKVFGTDTSHSTPDGYCEGYNVSEVVKIQDIKY